MCPVGVRTSHSTHALETGVAKLWLLLVGVNQYEDEQIPGLHYSALDCQGLGEALNAATQGFPQKEVMIYHDFGEKQPKLANIRASLKQIAAASKPTDTVIFYFSGHGMLDSLSQQVVLCLQDTQKEQLTDTGLKLQELLQLLENCSAQQQLLILDACHSGGMTLLGARGETDPQLNPTPELVEVLRKRASQRKGFYALLSCDRGQQSWEFPQLGHGVFTYYLIQGLRGEAADSVGVIEADGLYRYVYHQTLTYIDKANQQLRVINQLKKGRGDNSIHSEYPSQTPKRIVEGVGEVILGLKPQQIQSSQHPRQALIVEGLPKSKNSLDLSKILSSAGSFEVNYWTVRGKNSQSDVRKAIQKCLLSPSFAETTTPEAATTVFLYLRGQIRETEPGEARLILSEDIFIERSWLRKQLRRCRSQQIIILDCPEQQGLGTVSVRDWVEELQIGLDAGQCLITAAVPANDSEVFAYTLVETLNQGMQPTGLTAAAWITQLQVQLAQTNIQLYFWLSGSQGIIEILPGKTVFSVENLNTKPENTDNSKPDDLSSALGIDYTYLRDLLKNKRWLEADQETTKLILKASGRKEESFLEISDVINFSCKDLSTIDNLWVNYSYGHFGFSVQQRIWQSIKDTSATDPLLALMIGSAKVAASETCIDFANRVGWRLKDSWVDYENLVWQGDAPIGHLPYFGFLEQVWRVRLLGVWEWHSAIATASWWELCVALFSRLESCQVGDSDTA
ncbi:MULTISPECIES: GUN4 domain-containing protein [unclassified Tolypothrix]|uniref:GUN4 domain-containing protein n=1 Tax=unclassified Tolypothrix TaxID=2649714 RepID=UPI0005EAB741|nr:MULTISPECIES: GUN4 domain-containing protein [unclassified Tolypothrix]BAY92223.1 WD-40 repeat protein [Microchaete diplosiphon NIES-3275]EKE98609.1 ICE-like protease p20 domain protein [Tolypothrix sp. PCC 7601]MBE9086367.1 GUN4 domain-containing protein [Tolypothrix sp. LEGE 11397]UYD26197.1 GUN4 domain-containing protein [Tolypothrix sp. PCC 7712]UYD31566.1 GUN4 domain-containing protein [Tolypothrix sp. PCC 7601]